MTILIIQEGLQLICTNIHLHLCIFNIELILVTQCLILPLILLLLNNQPHILSPARLVSFGLVKSYVLFIFITYTCIIMRSLNKLLLRLETLKDILILNYLNWLMPQESIILWGMTTRPSLEMLTNSPSMTSNNVRMILRPGWNEPLVLTSTRVWSENLPLVH